MVLMKALALDINIKGGSVKIKFVINRKNKEIVDITCEKNKLNSNILKLFRLMIN